MKAKRNVVLTMILFGSIGLFVRKIPLKSSEIAFYRAAIGSLFLWMMSFLKKRTPDFASARKYAFPLFLSGLFMGLNWVFLFEAFKRTSIAQATMLYYTAPILVMVYYLFIEKKRVTNQKIGALILAFIGLVFTVSKGNVFAGKHPAPALLFAFGAAGCYAAVILLNTSFKGITKEDVTFFQLLIASFTLAPYVLLEGTTSLSTLSFVPLLLLLIVGVIHTGLAYQLYFGSLQELPAPTVAILSYIDPVSALFFSVFLLGEALTFFQLLGALFILLAAFLSEYTPKLKTK